MSDEDIEVKEVKEVPKKKYKNVKGDLAKKREQALENLKKGREMRLKNLKQKQKESRYDLEDSDDSESDSSDDELLTSIMKPKAKKVKEEPKVDNSRLDKLESAFTKMLQLQKHQMKKIKKAGKKKSEKIVLLPPSAPATAPAKVSKSNADALLDALKGGGTW
jgi:hypothetical protein